MNSTPSATSKRGAIAPGNSCAIAARIIIAAARSLCQDQTVVIDCHACRRVVVELAAAVKNPQATRKNILDVSPYVIERSGGVKTLVEMVETEGGDEAAKLRLARLLLRALEWRCAWGKDRTGHDRSEPTALSPRSIASLLERSDEVAGLAQPRNSRPKPAQLSQAQRSTSIRIFDF